MNYKGNKRNKKDANYKLEKSQLKNLNEEFYKYFNISYYDTKLINIMDILSNTSEYKNYIENKKIKYGKSSVNLDKVDEIELYNFSKTELNTMYFHCAETFIRLFIAHGKDTNCPWLEMCDLDIKTYRKYLKNISKGNVSCINSRISEEKLIMNVFFGQEKEIEEIGVGKDDYENLKEWIVWIANELLDSHKYNTYKHGMAIYPSNNKISISGGGKQIKAEGDTLRYFKKIEKDDRFVWAKEETYISYDSIMAIIFTINEMSKYIFNTRRYMYGIAKEYKKGWLPGKGWDFSFLMKKDIDNDFPVNISSYSVQLSYYK